MAGRARRMWLLGIAVIAGGLAVAAIAWACTPTAELRMDRNSGPPGSIVGVNGRGFSEGMVEIRLDSTDSAPVATASGPSFAISMTVPQTSPGWHVFGAVGYDADGNVVGDTSTTFFVPGPGAEQEQSAPVRHAPARNDPQPTPPRAAPQHAAPKHAAPQHAAAVARPAPVGHIAPRVHAPAERHAARVSGVAPAAQAAPPRHATARPLPRPAIGASAESRGAIEHRVNWQSSAASQQARLHDVWRAQPSAAASSSDSTSPGIAVALGAGLLGFGLVALFAGFAVAEVRRRRAPARARRRS